MRYLLITLIGVYLSSFPNIGHAIEVVATGSGATPDHALQNALQNAVRQETGTFLIVTSRTDQGQKTESTVTEHAGGIITSYELLSTSKSGDQYLASVRAEVVPNKNNEFRLSEGHDVPENLGNDLKHYQLAREQAIQAGQSLDRMHSALVAKVESVNIEPMGDMARIRIRYSVTLSQKWFDDLYSLAKSINRPLGKLDQAEKKLCFNFGFWQPDVCYEMFTDFSTLGWTQRDSRTRVTFKDGRNAWYEFPALGDYLPRINRKHFSYQPASIKRLVGLYGISGTEGLVISSKITEESEDMYEDIFLPMSEANKVQRVEIFPV